MEIALALSGGGYRAAIYHLGVLQYLNSCMLEDGRTLLDEVKTVSGVSGGAIVALWHIQNEIKQGDRERSFIDLYSRLCATNIAEQTIKEFYSNDFRGNTLVQALSNVYDKLLFDGAKFDSIMDMAENGPIHHFSVEATDFSNGIPFRFQATNNLGGDHPYGLIGNKPNNVPRELAKKLKLCDIAAASSCFPMAFEPLVIDENYCDEFKESAFFNSGKSIVLMDGGVVDNQAIDSVEKACQQLEAHNSKMDLCIISDAVNLDISQYERAEQKGSEITYNDIHKFLKRTCVAGIGMTCLYPISKMVSGAGVLLTILSAISLRKIDQITKRFLSKVPQEYKTILDEAHVEDIKAKDIVGFIQNRTSSLYLMTSEVVMQHIRRQHMSQVFAPDDHPWLLNAQYNLKDGGYWKKQMINLDLPPTMRPTKDMFDIADEANDMPTTLWFTQKNLSDNLPQKILASGQFVTCWNLLCCIKEQKIKHPEIKTILNTLEAKMERDWEEFKANPLCRTCNFV